MGGSGSGTWMRHTRKATVDESLTVAVDHVRTRAGWRPYGVITWTWSGEQQSSMAYYVDETTATPVVEFHYRLKGTDEITIPVEMQTTPVLKGKQRWWFTCPVVVDGVPCRRRVRKLYLPPGARYFGCRRCHDLTYRSCQKSHQTERMLRSLGFGDDKALVRIFTSGRRRQRV